ncbi:hypothetical protein F5J12DRAFT_786243 [Pisolithus orientalis]|uniref:uncharacterized protein n=1 Tax=Pisolithus orientalis TaxID=936130 RepID=UPI002224F767|nr:uncharacterized protein F5J12DRAFT_786243 [Pisolithus orientalis]KAI5992011.1 hypothetical protein F5J12DRAFT_786243 [Pisolithus orientalis]
MSWWVIIGGTKPGIYHGCPYILCGRLSPPLPITIECTSMDEAKLVMQTLDSVLQPILPELTTHDLVTFLNKSPAVQDLLKDTGDSFYAVVVGNPPSVHHTEDGATHVGSSFHWAKWKQIDTLHEALVYMVVKGIEDQLP